MLHQLLRNPQKPSFSIVINLAPYLAFKHTTWIPENFEKLQEHSEDLTKLFSNLPSKPSEAQFKVWYSRSLGSPSDSTQVRNLSNLLNLHLYFRSSHFFFAYFIQLWISKNDVTFNEVSSALFTYLVLFPCIALDKFCSSKFYYLISLMLICRMFGI